jgi:FAD/FMN-containing dehydrogenase
VPEATHVRDADIRAFERSFAGRVICARDAEYDDARAVWNRMIDRRPALIARCANTDDVVRAVRFGRDHDLPISIRGGGHNVTGNAVVDDGLMIDLSAMKAARVDAGRRVIATDPGLTWKDFDLATQPFGLATTGGIISSTGVAGLTLGGGHGWLMRRHGLTCDNLLSVLLITADGRLVAASANENPDLFWGVRGGGGNFGVVTSFEFGLHPVTSVLAGFVLYPLIRAREVFRVYRGCVAMAPDELAAAVLITTWADGTPAIAVVVCHAGDLGVGERLVQPVRSLGAPIVDTIRRMSYGELQTMFDATNPPGAWYYRTGYLTSDKVLGDDFVDVLLAQTNFPSPSPLSRIFIEHLGGEVARVPADATAFVHRVAPFDLIVIAGGFRPEETEKNFAWARGVSSAMRPFMSGGAYVNYLGADAGPDAVRAAYGPAWDRLVALKTKYDPDNVFRLNQNIRPATPARIPPH